MENLLLLATLLPMIGALLVFILKDKSDDLRANVSNGTVIAEFVLCAFLLMNAINGNELLFKLDYICGLGISLKLDGFRAMYASIAALMWMMTTIFTKEYFAHYSHKVRYYAFVLLTAGATVGVFLSADLFTTFIYFEIMSFASYAMVAHDQTEEALKAAETYIAVAIIGGMVMLMGLFMLHNMANTLVISELYEAIHAVEDKTMLFISGCLMLVGFGAKAGLYPLHIWLPKAHPVAPAPASALLSGILTKSGVYGMLVISMEIFREDPYWALLILVLGIITMLLGAILAVFSTIFKRTLACSSMSQIGFISVGLAMCIFLGHHNALAARGTILHMVNHSLIKLLLFMVAGVIYMNIHKLDLNDIQGYGRNKPLLKVLFLVGALGISGVPLFNGYVSKTLIHESIVEYIAITVNKRTYTLIEWLFIIAGGFTLAYMTKLFVCIFIEKNEDEALQNNYDSMKKYMNPTSSIVLMICALCLVALGVVPNITSDAIANLSQDFMHAHHLDHAIHYFSSVNLIGGLKSIVIGILVYLFFIRAVLMKKNHYVEVWPNWLDLEFLFYRPLVQYVLPFVFALVCRVIATLPEFVLLILNKTILRKIKIKKANQEDYMPGELQTFSRTSVFLSQIESSLSFGLLIAGLGIVFAMIYILTSFF